MFTAEQKALKGVLNKLGIPGDKKGSGDNLKLAFLLNKDFFTLEPAYTTIKRRLVIKFYDS